jgi:hypothetical protein
LFELLENVREVNTEFGKTWEGHGFSRATNDIIISLLKPLRVAFWANAPNLRG